MSHQLPWIEIISLSLRGIESLYISLDSNNLNLKVESNVKFGCYIKIIEEIQFTFLKRKAIDSFINCLERHLNEDSIIRSFQKALRTLFTLFDSSLIDLKYKHSQSLHFNFIYTWSSTSLHRLFLDEMIQIISDIYVTSNGSQVNSIYDLITSFKDNENPKLIDGWDLLTYILIHYSSSNSHLHTLWSDKEIFLSFQYWNINSIHRLSSNQSSEVSASYLKHFLIGYILKHSFQPLILELKENLFGGLLHSNQTKLNHTFHMDINQSSLFTSIDKIWNFDNEFNHSSVYHSFLSELIASIGLSSHRSQFISQSHSQNIQSYFVDLNNHHELSFPTSESEFKMYHQLIDRLRLISKQISMDLKLMTESWIDREIHHEEWFHHPKPVTPISMSNPSASVDQVIESTNERKDEVVMEKFLEESVKVQTIQQNNFIEFETTPNVLNISEKRVVEKHVYDEARTFITRKYSKKEKEIENKKLLAIWRIKRLKRIPLARLQLGAVYKQNAEDIVALSNQRRRNPIWYDEQMKRTLQQQQQQQQTSDYQPRWYQETSELLQVESEEVLSKGNALVESEDSGSLELRQEDEIPAISDTFAIVTHVISPDSVSLDNNLSDGNSLLRDSQEQIVTINQQIPEKPDLEKDNSSNLINSNQINDPMDVTIIFQEVGNQQDDAESFELIDKLIEPNNTHHQEATKPTEQKESELGWFVFTPLENLLHPNLDDIHHEESMMKMLSSFSRCLELIGLSIGSIKIESHDNVSEHRNPECLVKERNEMYSPYLSVSSKDCVESEINFKPFINLLDSSLGEMVRIQCKILNQLVLLTSIDRPLRSVPQENVFGCLSFIFKYFVISSKGNFLPSFSSYIVEKYMDINFRDSFKARYSLWETSFFTKCYRNYLMLNNSEQDDIQLFQITSDSKTKDPTQLSSLHEMQYNSSLDSILYMPSIIPVRPEKFANQSFNPLNGMFSIGGLSALCLTRSQHFSDLLAIVFHDDILKNISQLSRRYLEISQIHALIHQIWKQLRDKSKVASHRTADRATLSAHRVQERECYHIIKWIQTIVQSLYDFYNEQQYLRQQQLYQRLVGGCHEGIDTVITAIDQLANEFHELSLYFDGKDFEIIANVMTSRSSQRCSQWLGLKLQLNQLLNRCRRSLEYIFMNNLDDMQSRTNGDHVMLMSLKKELLKMHGEFIESLNLVRESSSHQHLAEVLATHLNF